MIRIFRPWLCAHARFVASIRSRAEVPNHSRVSDGSGNSLRNSHRVSLHPSQKHGTSLCPMFQCIDLSRLLHNDQTAHIRAIRQHGTRRRDQDNSHQTRRSRGKCGDDCPHMRPALKSPSAERPGLVPTSVANAMTAVTVGSIIARQGHMSCSTEWQSAGRRWAVQLQSCERTA